jgi:antitoxin VapB
MAIPINKQETDRLDRVVDEETGKTVADTLVVDLRKEFEADRGSGLGEDLRAISDRCGALPDLDLRSTEAILGFDEHGLPS